MDMETRGRILPLNDDHDQGDGKLGLCWGGASGYGHGEFDKPIAWFAIGNLYGSGYGAHCYGCGGRFGDGYGQGEDLTFG